MPKSLPARPNLEHLRAQAKTLLAALRDGEAEAARTFIDHLPEAAGLTPKQVRARGFRFADAQAAIARKNGFGKWPSLAHHVDRLRSMEGTWAFRSLEVDGRAMPPSMLSDSQLLIDGDRCQMKSPEAVYEGIFTIDVEAMPHGIDIDFVEGPEEGNRSEGIFELDGDRFRICLGLVGSDRPTTFASTPGSGHALEELVRAERSRPTGVDGGTPQAPPPTPKPAEDPGEFDGALTPTLEKLQGQWLPVELITSGKKLEKAYLPYGSRSHTGIETKVIFGGQTQLHAKVRVNETTMPIEVDYLNLSGKGKGAVSRGLFRWEGEDAVFCIAPAGALRPADFSCEAGSGRTLSRWKRK